MGVNTVGAAPEVQSLASRLDALEAAIMEAHSILDRVSTRPEEEAEEPTGEGGIACVGRCFQRMNALNQRLINAAELVGAL